MASSTTEEISSTTEEKDLTGQTIGILAGWGNYPIEVAIKLRQINAKVVTVGIRHHAPQELLELSDEYHEFGIGKLGSHQRYFKQHGVTKLVMAGKIFKDKVLFSRWSWLGALPDYKCFKTFAPYYISRKHDQRDDSILNAITNSYTEVGIEVVPGTLYASHLLAEEGVLTAAQPSFNVRKDIEFGWSIAKEMGKLDIGQSITVCDQDIVAVEAMEGTDACIGRTGSLCRNRFTLIKVAKPQQDERFDLPTIGPRTVQTLAEAGGTAIVIEQGKTILIDRAETIALANRLGISIVSLVDYEAHTAESIAA